MLAQLIRVWTRKTISKDQIKKSKLICLLSEGNCERSDYSDIAEEANFYVGERRLMLFDVEFGRCPMSERKLKNPSSQVADWKLFRTVMPYIFFEIRARNTHAVANTAT